MNKWLKALVTAAVGLIGLAVPAAAANIYTSYMSLPYYEIVSLSGGLLGTPTGVYAGQQILTVNNGSTYDPLGTYTLDAWCVDFSHDIFIGTNSISFTLSSLTDNHLGATPTASDALSTATAQELAGLVVYGNHVMQVAPSNFLSAAVQVAIWNIEYGSVYAGSDQALAQEVSYLMSIAPSLSSTAGELLESFDATGTFYQAQSLLFASTAVVGAPAVSAVVAEPASISLLGVGLLGMSLAWHGANRRVSRSARYNRVG